MNHPFAMKEVELENVEIAEITVEECAVVAGGKKPIYTTLAIGEEGGEEPPVEI